MEITEIRNLTTDELSKKIIETKQALFDLRLKQSTGALEKTSDLKKLRKTVAKMKTVLREKEIGGTK